MSARIALVLFAIVATTIMGSFVVAALAMGYDTAKPIIFAAVLGFASAIPSSMLIAGRLSEMTSDNDEMQGSH